MTDDSIIRIDIDGLDVLDRNFTRFKGEIKKYVQQGGKEAGEMVLETEGLRKYPPLTSANQEPTPFYIRGRGTETAYGNRGNSEKLGANFYVKSEGYWNTKVGNRVSYARYVVGDEQAYHMGPNARIPKGWRKLIDVAKENIVGITAKYQQWIDKCIRDMGLK